MIPPLTAAIKGATAGASYSGKSASSAGISGCSWWWKILSSQRWGWAEARGGVAAGEGECAATAACCADCAIATDVLATEAGL